MLKRSSIKDVCKDVEEVKDLADDNKLKFLFHFSSRFCRCSFKDECLYINYLIFFIYNNYAVHPKA